MSVRIVLALALFAAPARAQLAPWPDGSRLFASQKGWIGADAAYAIALGPDRLLWLFGDTFVGEVKAGRRDGAVMVRNTVGVHEGGRMRFHLGRGTPGVFAPPDGKGWIWPLDGVRAGRALYVFLSQIESTGDPSAFGFRVVGHWLARVSNPDAAPERWRVTTERVPFEGHGTAVHADGATLYIYGYRDEQRAGRLRRSAVVARAPLFAPCAFDRWRFWDGARWTSDPAGAAPLFDEWPTESSVHRRADGTWTAVYTRHGMSPEIMMRTARRPEGPWSDARVIYRCPEASRPGVFCYAAKAHPEIGAVTYCTNSARLAIVVADEKLYRPVVLRGSY